jgi:hypothetical protein
MRQILLIFLMFFTLSSFAYSLSNLEETKIETISYEFENSKNQNTLNSANQYLRDIGCSITFVNTETGETRKIYALGFGVQNQKLKPIVEVKLLN